MHPAIKNLISSVKGISRRLKRRVKWEPALGRVVRRASEGGHCSEDRDRVSGRSRSEGRSKQRDYEWQVCEAGESSDASGGERKPSVRETGTSWSCRGGQGLKQQSPVTRGFFFNVSS